MGKNMPGSCPAWTVVGVGAFGSAVIIYLLEKLPVLCFSFKDRENGFLYCKLQNLPFLFSLDCSSVFNLIVFLSDACLSWC